MLTYGEQIKYETKMANPSSFSQRGRLNVLLLFLWLMLPIVVLGSVITWSVSRNIEIGLVWRFCLVSHSNSAAGLGHRTEEL